MTRLADCAELFLKSKKLEVVSEDVKRKVKEVKK
jgi:hypothetical protein